jgi:hypothetical protein
MQTNLKDCNGISIKAGDIVRDNEGFTGKVMFINGAWRYDVLDGRLLKFNSSLLFKEGVGTSHLEVIAQAPQVATQEEALLSVLPNNNYKPVSQERQS